MIIRTFSILAAMVLLVSFNASAMVHYVDLNCTNPVSPYTNWSTAATNLQNAINTATPGDLVLASNGVYHSYNVVFYVNLTNAYLYASNQTQAVVYAEIGIPNGVTVSSVNGPRVTFIEGSYSACACLIGNSVLSGFTLFNGTAQYGQPAPTFGGGAYCTTTNGIITNCIICSNSASFGGGVYQGTLNNCVVSSNVASSAGGATAGSVMNNCTISGNGSNPGAFSWGSVSSGGVLNNCLVISNYASRAGICTSNVMNNCLIIYNSGGVDGTSVATGSALTNCTICYNGTRVGDGVVAFNKCVLRNCILYYNVYIYDVVYTGNDLQFCCLEPQTIFASAVYGTNNFTNAPSFLNLGNDFHLQASSPCINAGNNANVSGTNDLDGNPRIVGATVDIGAYEFQSPQSIISYQWLQQYGLPTDGSADYADTDGDGINNWQEWIAGTDPTNPSSLLKMLNTASTTNSPGLVVSWESVNTRSYFLQSSTNFAGEPAFATIQSNLVGQAGTTSYTDTTVTNGSAHFYRVGVQ